MGISKIPNGRRSGGGPVKIRARPFFKPALGAIIVAFGAAFSLFANPSAAQPPEDEMARRAAAPFEMNGHRASGMPARPPRRFIALNLPGSPRALGTIPSAVLMKPGLDFSGRRCPTIGSYDKDWVRNQLVFGIVGVSAAGTGLALALIGGLALGGTVIGGIMLVLGVPGILIGLLMGPISLATYSECR